MNPNLDNATHGETLVDYVRISGILIFVALIGVPMIVGPQIDLIINTPSGKTPRKDEVKIRSTTVERRIPILTTISGVEASVRAMCSTKTKVLTVKSLQEYHL